MLTVCLGRYVLSNAKRRQMMFPGSDGVHQCKRSKQSQPIYYHRHGYPELETRGLISPQWIDSYHVLKSIFCHFLLSTHNRATTLTYRASVVDEGLAQQRFLERSYQQRGACLQFRGQHHLNRYFGQPFIAAILLEGARMQSVNQS